MVNIRWGTCFDASKLPVAISVILFALLLLSYIGFIFVGADYAKDLPASVILLTIFLINLAVGFAIYIYNGFRCVKNYGLDYLESAVSGGATGLLSSLLNGVLLFLLFMGMIVAILLPFVSQVPSGDLAQIVPILFIFGFSTVLYLIYIMLTVIMSSFFWLFTGAVLSVAGAIISNKLSTAPTRKRPKTTTFKARLKKK